MRGMSEMCSDLSSFLIGRGAALVGFADLAEVPAEDRASMRYGVSIAAALAPGIVAGIRGGPTAEYRAEYDRVNEFLCRLADGAAEVLEKNGHRAVPRAATHEGIDWERLRTALPHKTVATRAGLGWIGKCALLVTEAYGRATSACPSGNQTGLC